MRAREASTHCFRRNGAFRLLPTSRPMPTWPTPTSTRRPLPTLRGSGPGWRRSWTGSEKWDTVLDWSGAPFAKWFIGGKLNVSYNCIDRHVKNGRRNKAAIVWEGEPGDWEGVHLRRPAARGLPVRQWTEEPRHQEGRPRDHLPANDAGTAHRHAGPAPASGRHTAWYSAGSAPSRCGTASTIRSRSC